MGGTDTARAMLCTPSIRLRNGRGTVQAAALPPVTAVW
jgi:hypothetical protein